MKTILICLTKVYEVVWIKVFFKQITITLNPWNERHWIKARFFDVIDSNIMAKSTNYMCNEWLDESDLKVF